MFMPSILGDNFMEDFFDFPERAFSRNYGEKGMMQTDVTESDKGYEVAMNLPGFTKEDIKGQIKDGYLTITANTNKDNEEKDKEGRYIRRERYSGTCSRTFYVGDTVTEEDIKAKFDNGVLKLSIPKKSKEEIPEQEKYIAIEG